MGGEGEGVAMNMFHRSLCFTCRSGVRDTCERMCLLNVGVAVSPNKMKHCLRQTWCVHLKKASVGFILSRRVFSNILGRGNSCTFLEQTTLQIRTGDVVIFHDLVTWLNSHRRMEKNVMIAKSKVIMFANRF